MWNINLTKADKRRCRELIHIGLERECENFVKDILELANKPFPQEELDEPYKEENGKSVEGPWHKRYVAIFKKTDEYDNHVAKRYDGMTGGHYLDAVLSLYLDGILSDEDIAPLSDEIRDFISRYKNMVDS